MIYLDKTFNTTFAIGLGADFFGNADLQTAGDIYELAPCCSSRRAWHNAQIGPSITPSSRE